MSNELTINTLGDTVRDRVKSAIFNCIPDAAIDILIQSEFTKMTEEKEENYNGKWQKTSPLRVMLSNEIKKQLNEKAIESIKKYLDETYQNQSKEMVNTAIKEIAPLFMASMVESFAATAVQNLRNQLSNKGIYL